MDPYRYDIRPVPLHGAALRQLDAFLEANGLRLDRLITRYLGVFEGEKLVAGGGYAGRVLRCIAVDPAHRGEGLLGALLARLRAELAEQGHLFLFTKPQNEPLFADLGFTALERAAEALLMTSDPGDFTRYLARLAALRTLGPIGCCVLNANPFTLGHRYLVERAAARCTRLMVFVVEEELSELPFPVRIRLVREGCADLRGVTVLPGGDYIISQATFPSYFLKTADAAARAYCELDLRVFAHHIAPAAGITRRFVGEEPFSPVTALYNETMRRILPEAGIALDILPRQAVAGEPVSASRVRALLAAGRLEEARPLLPETTYRFFTHPEAKPVLDRIRAGIGREGAAR